jgi:class 3 adenylate cyclase
LSALKLRKEQQRKLVAILFMDIAGHTQLIRNLDPEENMEIIDKALVRLTQPVLDYGGHIARPSGDGFKAVLASNRT